MAFELQNIIQSCMLESGARKAVLIVIAGYADIETGLARISRVQLAALARLSERTIQRVLADLLSDPDLAGLLRLVRPASGRGNAATYLIDLRRLEPLSDAVKAAGRRVFARVPRAMLDIGLCGAPASPANIRAVFSVLGRLLEDEGEGGARRLVQAHAETFETVMAEQQDISVIGRTETGEAIKIRDLDFAQKTAPEPVEKAPVSRSRGCGKKAGKGDIASRKGDILTYPHNKDTSPSGNNTLGEGPREPCGKIIAAGATDARDFVLDAEGVIAHATLCRADRLALIRDLQGRMARVSASGLLMIRVESTAEGEAIAARWLEPLLGWASVAGLSGVVFDAAVRAPP